MGIATCGRPIIEPLQGRSLIVLPSSTVGIVTIIVLDLRQRSFIHWGPTTHGEWGKDPHPTTVFRKL